MEIVYVYTKKRSDFGRQACFSDVPPFPCIDYQPEPALRNDYIYKDPVDIAIQNVSTMSEHEVFMCTKLKLNVSTMLLNFPGQYRAIRNREQRHQSCGGKLA